MTVLGFTGVICTLKRETSQLPIDLQFKSLFQEISPETHEVELLYDSSTHFDRDSIG